MRFGLVKLVVSAIVTEVALKLWLGFDHTAVKLQIGRFLELDVHRDRIELTVRGHCQQHDVTPSGCNTPILINGTLGLGLEDDIRMSVVGVDTRSAESFEAEVLLVGDRSQLSSAVLKVSIEDINDGVQCVAVEWLHTVYDSRVTAEQHLNADCFTLSSEIGGHWYGGPEVLEQRWPIDLQKSTVQSHVTGDFLSPKWRRQPGFGKYGPIAEPYWVTSTGIAILVAGGYDFRSGFNDDGTGRLCLQGVATTRDARQTANLKYHVCRGENVLNVHRAVAAKFIQRPVATPDSLIIQKPIWSTWARYKVGVDEAAVDELAREIQRYGFQCRLVFLSSSNHESTVNQSCEHSLYFRDYVRGFFASFLENIRSV
jgi:hypothetical protein